MLIRIMIESRLTSCSKEYHVPMFSNIFMPVTPVCFHIQLELSLLYCICHRRTLDLLRSLNSNDYVGI